MNKFKNAVYVMNEANQQAALDDGYVWADGSSHLKHLGVKYLQTYNDGCLGCANFENVGAIETYPTLLQKDNKRYWNGKEELEVGMWVTTETKNEYKTILVNDKSFVIEDEDGFLVSLTKAVAKPIDKRTDKEKFIDEIMGNYSGDNSREDLIGKAYDKLTENKNEIPTRKST